MSALFVGMDVSKDCLDVCVRPTAELFSVADRTADIQTLVQRLQALTPTLVVLEATGGREASAARTLLAAGLAVTVANPLQVRQFARATGKRAKTDPLDARALCRSVAPIWVGHMVRAAVQAAR